VLGAADLVAFVASTDAARAREFYGSALGLPLVEETAFACVFRAPNAVLRVTLVDAVAPAPYTVLGWAVEDVDATVRRLAERGVEPLRYDALEQDELGVWRSPGGALVAWFRDPDGNVLSVTQHAGGTA
jgi:catechol 2,3-dioxygenase-like lactoylglutathione lyase family enzyme